MNQDFQKQERRLLNVYFVCAVIASLCLLVGQFTISSTIRSDWFFIGAVFSAFNIKLFSRIIRGLLSGTAPAGIVVLLGMAKTMVLFGVLFYIARQGSGALIYAILGYLLFIPASFVYLARER